MKRDFPREEILDSGLAYMKKSYPRNETVYRSVIYVSLNLMFIGPCIIVIVDE